jgi:hypothetical protein
MLPMQVAIEHLIPDLFLGVDTIGELELPVFLWRNFENIDSEHLHFVWLFINGAIWRRWL